MQNLTQKWFVDKDTKEMKGMMLINKDTKERTTMMLIPYAFAIGSIMYDMLCIKINMACVVSVMKRCYPI